LDSLTPTASGVLAVKLSSQRPDYLMWFRKEQLLSVTWAGDPSKPMLDNNPLELSPRRSFAAWSEIVRGTAVPWSGAELLLARAVGVSLIDIIVQVNAVRLLVAEHQLTGVRATVQSSQEPVAITDGKGLLIFANAACYKLLGQSPTLLKQAADLSQAFAQPALFLRGLESAAQLKQAWRGELALAPHDLTVGVRAEFVPGRDGQVLGYIVVLADLQDSRRVHAARQHLEQSLMAAASGPDDRRDDVIGAILASAGLAAMDIADTATGPGVAPLLEEVEASAKRAASLYARIRRWAKP
jgi:PAS domain-containing protein